ncbi:unnamed protein product [Ectocarpus sp. CCAP 1310/34]|nr:unnamed protein product [Ectocarpus sp. CCAP 1310/34]
MVALLRVTAVAAALAVVVNAAHPSALSVQLTSNKNHAGRGRNMLSAAAGRRLGEGGGVGTVDVNDCENMEYTGVISLGTPPQEFRVIFSIATSYLWVANTDCEFCGSPSGGYDASLSSTYEADGSPFSIEDAYDYTILTGFLSNDVLTMGGMSTAVTFAEMTEAELEGCTEVDGEMGMGLTNDEETNAFEDMVEAGVVGLPIFSFFLGNMDASEGPHGVLTLGGVNQTHYEGCLEWVATSDALDGTSELPGAVPEGFWSVGLRDIKYGSESMLSSRAAAILDTGASLIQGPFDDVAMIADMIGAMCIKFTEVMEASSSSSADIIECMNDPREVELILVECATDFDDINFFFGGDDFALTETELLQPLTDFASTDSVFDPMCIFGMIGADLTDTWVLGDPFLRTFYTAYNVQTQTVGIARATGSRTGEACEADAALDSGAPSAAVPADGDDDGAGLGVASAPEGANSSEVVEGETSVVTVGVVAGLGTMALLGLGVVALAVRQRWKRTGGGVYRSAMSQVGGGGGSGGFEMSKGMSSSMAARHGEEAVEREEDFLQASPCDSSFRSSSNASAGSGGRSKRVIRTGQGGDEVAAGGTATGAGAPGVFGRLLGGAPARAGFAAFEDADDGDAGVQ